MQNQVALGAKRSPTLVKGGIARAPGLQSRWACTGDMYGGSPNDVKGYLSKECVQCGRV